LPLLPTRATYLRAADHGNAAGELRQPFLKLLLVVVISEVVSSI
jgi:hypothetical protein